jgi:hypothetical protein
MNTRVVAGAMSVTPKEAQTIRKCLALIGGVVLKV